MPRLVMNPPSWWKPDPNQVRKTVDEEEDRRLTESIRRWGVLQPPGALEDGTGQFGHRRARCALAAGLEVMPFYILERPMAEGELRGSTLITQLTENIQRLPLTDPEVYLACKEICRLYDGWQKKDLANHLGKSASWVTHALSPDDLIPPAREAFLGGAFGFSVAYEISKAPESVQPLLLAAQRSGASRAELARQVRRSHAAAEPVAKVSRVKCQLAGACVTVAAAGDALTLDSLIETLSDLLKTARRASDQGWTVSTFARALRDKASHD